MSLRLVGGPRILGTRLVLGSEPPRLPLAEDAGGVGVTAAVDVALRREQDVLAHRVQQLAAERAAVGARLPALGAAERPPARLVAGRGHGA